MKSCYFLFLCLFIGSCTTNDTHEVPDSDVPPNIILIVADDHGTADLSCLDLLDDVQTPHLDALAASGARFTEAYATSPICSPSRMSLLTGVHHQRFGTYWYGGLGIHRPEYATIAELLKQKEYTTGYIGKVHYGKNDRDTTNRNFPTNHGFDYFFGHTSARKHYLHHDDALETAFLDSKNQHERKGQSLRQGHLWRNRQPVDTTAFSTQLFGEEARQFISRHQQTPFFLQLSFNAVHNFTHQLPESYLKEKGLKGYRDWDPAVEEYYDWYQQGRLPNNPEGRAHYLGQLHYLDQEIGALTRHLETLGLSANTMIIYIGDNGGSTPIYAMNQPLRGGKYMLYQGGIRVPLLIAMPDRFEGNRVLDNRVSGLD
ncbi:MAG: sulfatase-like hydrolase/transferase, partial [Bacteroidota bacterium]